jgi:hypothetical protein
MTWADQTIAELKKTGHAEVRPKGRSMEPLINSGDLVGLTYHFILKEPKKPDSKPNDRADRWRIEINSYPQDMSGVREDGKSSVHPPPKFDIGMGMVLKGATIGSIVLVRVGDNTYLHLIKDIDKVNGRVLIGNNKGRINGWAPFSNIYGLVVRIRGTECPIT